MAEIMSVARFSIHPGKTEEFKSLAAECVRIVRERDPATSLYEWFMNQDGTECIAVDRYASSEAVLAHIGNVGPTMRKLRSLAEISVELLGDPSAALVAALQFKSSEIFPRLDGLT
jgi:quinol monooxygenase YgiN